MNKNIAILSMQEVINYGSFLQAYALKQMLLDAGAEKVEFIPIKRDRFLPGYELPTFSQSLIRKLRKFLRDPIEIFNLIPRHFFQKKYNRSIVSHWPSIGIGEPVKESHHDLTVIGSDEVFNCCQTVPWGFSSMLYGNIPSSDQVASYAGSFGSTTLDDIKSLGLTEELASYLGRMSAISVRDENSFKIIETLTGTKPAIHVDPVLAYDYSKVIDAQFDHPDKDYIIVYTYQNRITAQEKKTIRHFAKERGKKILSLMCRYSWCDGYIIPSDPFEVLRWFRHADYVVTDTFHGTIFSVITHRQFVSLVREGNNNKLSYLLKHLDLSTRAASSETIEKVLDAQIDYTTVDTTLDNLRSQTRNYLTSLIVL